MYTIQKQSLASHVRTSTNKKRITQINEIHQLPYTLSVPTEIFFKETREYDRVILVRSARWLSTKNQLYAPLINFLEPSIILRKLVKPTPSRNRQAVNRTYSFAIGACLDLAMH